MACIINHPIQWKQSERELSTIHGIHCWFMSRKHIKQLHLVRYPSMDDCCMIDIWLPTPLLPRPQHPLSYLAPALENINIPARQVLVRLLWVGGETTSRPTVRTWSSCLVNFATRSCQDAESWVVLLDLSSLPHKALQLRLGPSHVAHEMALVCRDSSLGPWRYCACNTVVSSDCHVHFRGQLTSRSLFVGNVTSETHHIIYQNDACDSRNCSIFRKISVRTSCKKLWTVTEKMWESLFFCYKTGRDIIPLKLVPF